MVRGSARLLHLVVLDGRAFGNLDLGDDVVEIYGVVKSDEVLDDGDSRSRTGCDEDPGKVRAFALVRPGYEHEMQRRAGDRLRGDPDRRTGIHERGIERGERGLLRGHDFREPAFEELAVVFEGAGEILDLDAARQCPSVRELVVDTPVDEYEARRGATIQESSHNAGAGRGAGRRREVERALLDG